MNVVDVVVDPVFLVFLVVIIGVVGVVLVAETVPVAEFICRSAAKTNVID